jgi:hypothetical protein
VARFLAILAALGILGLFGPGGALLTAMFTDRVDIQMVEADGTVRNAVFGPNAPYPAWLLLPPDASIITGGVFSPTPQQGAGGSLELAVSGDMEALLAAYQARLAADGFTARRTTDRTDALFDIEATLQAEHPESGRRLRILVRRDGWRRFAQISYWEPYRANP